MRWPQLSCGPRAGPNVPVTSEPWTPRVSWIADVPGRGLVRVGSAAAGSVFRFVLVSVLRGQCPWLSARSGGWEPAGTDIWRTASLRQTSSSGIYAGQMPYEGAGRSGL